MADLGTIVEHLRDARDAALWGNYPYAYDSYDLAQNLILERARLHANLDEAETIFFNDLSFKT